MQQRRLSQNPPAITPQGQTIVVPEDYWKTLINRDLTALCNMTLSEPHDNGLVFVFLNQRIMIDFNERCLKENYEGNWERLDDPLFELISLLYFNRVKALHPKGCKLVSTHDLKEGHFFKGPHALNLGPLLQRFQDHLSDFEHAANALCGEKAEMADASFVFYPFPRIPVYYLLWEKDSKFDAKADVLFDASIEHYLDAAGIWGLVNLVTRCILQINTN